MITTLGYMLLCDAHSCKSGGYIRIDAVSRTGARSIAEKAGWRRRRDGLGGFADLCPACLAAEADGEPLHFGEFGGAA